MDTIDARNLCMFVTSLNKDMEKRSLAAAIHTNLKKFRKFHKLKIVGMQEST